MREVFIADGRLPADDEGEDRLLPGLDIYWLGWHLLRNDRQFGAMGGSAGIQYASMSQFARDHGIGGAERDIFVALLMAMDAEYLVWQGEQRPSEPKQ